MTEPLILFLRWDEERIKGATIHVETGQPATWVSEGAISDFNGAATPPILVKVLPVTPAGGYCYQYSTSGKSAGEWYLPSAGELTLLWELQKTGVICKRPNKIVSMISHAGNWSSSEHSAESAWYLNFVSGAIVANSKASIRHALSHSSKVPMEVAAPLVIND